MPLAQSKEASLQSILPKGRYEISRVLGTGGFGQVFAGRDLLTSTPVVLKLLELPTPEARARIEREIALLKKLTISPHLVQLIDGYFAPDATAAALISEYVAGPTIQTLVEGHGRGIPDTVVAAVARQLCAGLEQLHRQGIVHRDIKPSNVLIANDGMVKLLDLGIAVSMEGEKKDDDSDITKVGTFVGTLRYAAPEMLAGRAYGPASDVYALGVTTLYMLLGRQPLEAASFPFMISQILGGALIKELPEPLQATWGSILTAVLDVNPDKRPSPGTLANMLSSGFSTKDQNDVGIVALFLQNSAASQDPPASPPTPIGSAPATEVDHSLKGTIQFLASQIHEVQAAVADMTATFRNRDLPVAGPVSVPAPAVPASPGPDERIDATFATVRRRLEMNWRVSLLMTFVLFSMFVAMLVLAVVFGVVYQKSYFGILFGGTSALSLLTVVVWKPMDKMLFATIATQQLELIQLNYERALSGSREERREAFRDVSTQLNALLTKVAAKSR